MLSLSRVAGSLGSLNLMPAMAWDKWNGCKNVRSLYRKRPKGHNAKRKAKRKAQRAARKST